MDGEVMRNRVARWGRILALLAAAATLSGCFVAADLIEEDLLRALGVNPSLLSGEPGKIVVAFNNTTRSPAEMAVIYTETTESETYRWERIQTVPAGEISNAVIDCPVTRLTPGRLVGEAAQAATVIAVGGQGGAVVAYEGAALTRADFSCGDLIIVTLSEVAATGQEQQAGFAIRVRVVPGQ
jgi:hypothetical protein